MTVFPIRVVAYLMRWNWPTVEAIFGSLLPVIRQETDDSYNPIRHWRVPEIEGCKPAAGQVALVKFAQFLSHNLERQHLPSNDGANACKARAATGCHFSIQV